MARFDIPDGWRAQAYRFALDPSPDQVRVLGSHCGAARFAFNHLLDVVKTNLDQRAAERCYVNFPRFPGDSAIWIRRLRVGG